MTNKEQHRVSPPCPTYCGVHWFISRPRYWLFCFYGFP